MFVAFAFIVDDPIVVLHPEEKFIKMSSCMALGCVSCVAHVYDQDVPQQEVLLDDMNVLVRSEAFQVEY